MMNDSPYVELRVTLEHRGDRFAYQERFEPRAVFDRHDLGAGLFAVPNRHNLRVALYRVLWRLIAHAHRDITERYGVPIDLLTAERRMFRLPYSTEWHDDEGDALLNALVPQTRGEAFIEASQDANKRAQRAV